MKTYDWAQVSQSTWSISPCALRDLPLAAHAESRSVSPLRVSVEWVFTYLLEPGLTPPFPND